MSIQWVAWVFEESPTKLSDRLVLLSLANHASEDGVCWPGRKTIAREAGISVRTLEGCLQRLSRDGWIRRKVNGAPQEMMRRKGINNAPNLFQLTKTPHEFEDTRAFRNVRDPQDAGVRKSRTPKSGTPKSRTAESRTRTIREKNRQERKRNRKILNQYLRNVSED